MQHKLDLAFIKHAGMAHIVRTTLGQFDVCHAYVRHNRYARPFSHGEQYDAVTSTKYDPLLIPSRTVISFGVSLWVQLLT